MQADHPSYPPSGYANLVQLLVRLEDLCMAEAWNNRMIEGQLRRTGQVVLAIQSDRQVHCLYSSLAPGRSETERDSRNVAYPQGSSSAMLAQSEVQLCGYVWFEDRSIVDDEATEASWELLRIGIIPDFRHRSMGNALLQKGLEFLSHQRHFQPDQPGAAEPDADGRAEQPEPPPEPLCDRILLEVAETNTPARKLYDSFGFNVIHRRKNYYADSDALIMERPGGNVQ